MRTRWKIVWHPDLGHERGDLRNKRGNARAFYRIVLVGTKYGAGYKSYNTRAVPSSSSSRHSTGWVYNMSITNCCRSSFFAVFFFSLFCFRCFYSLCTHTRLQISTTGQENKPCFESGGGDVPGILKNKRTLVAIGFGKYNNVNSATPIHVTKKTNKLLNIKCIIRFYFFNCFRTCYT